MPSTSPPPWHLVRQSSIHNQGVFAARDIPAGTRILDYKGHRITKAESVRRGNAQIEDSAKTGEGAVYIFVLNKKYDIDGNVPWNDARLINHTCEPNCEAQIIRGTIWLVALQDIPEGTELGFNYGFDLETWEDHPCRCGTASCCGYIVGREYWPKLKRLIRKRQQVIEKDKAAATAPARRSKKAGSPSRPRPSRKSQANPLPKTGKAAANNSPGGRIPSPAGTKRKSLAGAAKGQSKTAGRTGKANAKTPRRQIR